MFQICLSTSGAAVTPPWSPSTGRSAPRSCGSKPKSLRPGRTRLAGPPLPASWRLAIPRAQTAWRGRWVLNRWLNINRIYFRGKTFVFCVEQRFGHVPQPAEGRRDLVQSERVSERHGQVVAQRQPPHGGPLAGKTRAGEQTHQSTHQTKKL